MNDGLRSDVSFDSAFRAKIHTALEVILSLSYLSKIEAAHPARVRAHMGMIEQRIRELRPFMSLSEDGPPGDDTSNVRRIPTVGTKTSIE
jgi:hypothetical protein